MRKDEVWFDPFNDAVLALLSSSLKDSPENIEKFIENKLNELIATIF